ncbi:alpha/beta hydrolase, partial [Kibdelosporangium lantanae]
MSYALDPELAAWQDMVPEFSVSALDDLPAARKMINEMRHLLPAYEPTRELTVEDVIADGVR